jgi:hypothetical protein
MEEAQNLTVQFRTDAEGSIIGQFPSLDGSGNDLTGQLRGKVGDKYSRLVPTEYCLFDREGNPASEFQGEFDKLKKKRKFVLQNLIFRLFNTTI